VHISSTDVYGYPDRADVEESYTATRFRNWYAQTKLEAEVEVRRAQRAHALDAVILRPATVYGPGSKDVVGEIARAIQGRHMLLIDGGRANAGLCYAENLIDAALLALHQNAARGCAFNVTDGLEHGYRLLRRTTGLHAQPLLSRQAVQVLGKNQNFSNRKLRDTLGWEPRVGYATGLQATLAWLADEYLPDAATRAR
jgi:nucleoside-diphosphate-sugar epimerase